MAVIVKMNLVDGFDGGLELSDAITAARLFAEAGADAIVLSAGFTSRNGFYMLRGRVPLWPMITAVGRSPASPIMPRTTGYAGCGSSYAYNGSRGPASLASGRSPMAFPFVYSRLRMRMRLNNACLPAPADGRVGD